MLRCPVCKNGLEKKARAWVCDLGHSYDISRKNTVNLLMSQKQKVHGDDKGMMEARSRFLDMGYYRILCDALIRNIPPHAKTGLDLGCGEGWYTKQIYDASGLALVGVDISKVGVEAGSRRDVGITWVVGSSYAIPLMDQSCDCVWSVFAPFDEQEVIRVLRDDGVFLQIIPRTDHLLELKEAIYDTVRLNDSAPYLEHMNCILEESIEAIIDLPNQQAILDLFTMTPYRYHTPLEFQKRLDKLDNLRVRIACDLRKYIKNEN